MDVEATTPTENVVVAAQQQQQQQIVDESEENQQHQNTNQYSHGALSPQQQLQNKRKLSEMMTLNSNINNNDDNKINVNTNNILATTTNNSDNITNSVALPEAKSTTTTTTTDQLLHLNSIPLSDEQQRLVENTVQQLKKKICVNKLKHLNELHLNRISSLNEQQNIENGAKQNHTNSLLMLVGGGGLINKASSSAPSKSLSTVNQSDKGNAMSIAERAKHEAHILQRINHLRREGLWSIKRLPKLVEPPRAKTHWDFLLDEMTWMSTDFQQERKWKKNCSRKLSMAIQKYFKDKELKAEMAERDEQKRLRKQAQFVAREIMQFWRNVEKVIEYKQRTRFEEKRKQAMDLQLNFIVDQTEKYSSWLLQSMSATSVGAEFGTSMAVETSASAASRSTLMLAMAPTTSTTSRESESKVATDVNKYINDSSNVQEQKTQSTTTTTTTTATVVVPKEEPMQQDNDDDDDDEYDENDTDNESEDDESTIAKEEKMQNMDVDKVRKVSDELAALQAESELPLDELLKDYKIDDDYLQATSTTTIDSTKDNERSTTTTTRRGQRSSRRSMETEESDYEDDYNDEEETSEEDDEETIEREEVLAALGYYNVDEELQALKAESNIPIEQLLFSSKDNEQPNSSRLERSNTLAATANSASALNTASASETLSSTVNDDKMLNSIAATAQSLQPTGYTLETTHVKTRVPSELLRHSLREYQHVGLDWLVTMYENKLNGILADEMGLGKTIQTIALLAHLACEKGVWGPHLIVVPTSVMLNWELEFKKWAPGFKILTYYGSPKERRLKRQGWTKMNAFHVCITSYKLVVQDHAAFRRKKWKYFILDEAQHIKNFRSQRWQALLNFQSQRRLLLTGTPLQNNLMELWSLMHFLMPHVFSSHREFQHWFSNPLKCMLEGGQEYNEQLIKRLHKVLRPFILRRLKADVEKQMPKKYEHVVQCKLSKRQRLLYDEFMSLGSTKQTLNEGHYMSVINVLMQLRKVCNHPDLFDPRPIVSSFGMEPLECELPSLVYNMREEIVEERLRTLLYYQPSLVDLECTQSAFACHRSKQLQTPRKLIEEVCIAKYEDQSGTATPMETVVNPNVAVASPFLPDNSMHGIESHEQPVGAALTSRPTLARRQQQSLQRFKYVGHYLGRLNRHRCNFVRPVYGKDLQECVGNERVLLEPIITRRSSSLTPFFYNACSHSTCERNKSYESRKHLPHVYWSQTQTLSDLLNVVTSGLFDPSRNHCWWDILARFIFYVPHVSFTSSSSFLSSLSSLSSFIMSAPDHRGTVVRMRVPHPSPSLMQRHRALIVDITNEYNRNLTTSYTVSHTALDILGRIECSMSVQFPEKRLIEYDCGKLQTLAQLLRTLYAETHRVLIFTQMTRMLDILENFLNYHGYKYLRLDGSTSIEQRQSLMERFNNDKRIFCFILSTRSGGIGVNLTGADTVVFYDSDWNPTMDAQAQDRCHRIGQTRDVHIYRLISERTVEENILKKANQKRLLSDVTLEGGCFTTALLKRHHITELFEQPTGLSSYIASLNAAESNEITNTTSDDQIITELPVTTTTTTTTTSTTPIFNNEQIGESQFEAVCLIFFLF
jgi:SNF2 family DNA or RNA helicase